ncbi:MAG: CRTAC1 family protein [Pirellulaceae bacterium]
MKLTRIVPPAAVLLTFFVFGMRFATAQAPIRLTDVTPTSGIDFQQHDGSSGNYYIVETMSGAVALLDYDNDGDVDIYFLNGQSVDEADRVSPLATNRLYRNDGHFRFQDVTQQAGVGDTGHGLGVAVADYDGDGWLDVYVNNFGPNVLYRNRGDGTFEDVTNRAGVANGHRTGAGVCFLDYDGDGDLDLFVANYIQFDARKHVARTKQGVPVYGSPADYAFDADTLFRNNGDGTFTDVSAESGIGQIRLPSMGAIASDVDQDGDVDILVANDGQTNSLYRNDGQGRFVEQALLMGFAYDAMGKTHASMGVASADFDHDGWFDYHVTSFQGESASLYRNLQGKYLDDVSVRWNAAAVTRPPVTWGNAAVDLDADGFEDLVIACGHLYDRVAEIDSTTRYALPNLVLRNETGKRFANVSSQAGGGMQVEAVSRGVAVDDLDNDGDVDVVISNLRSRPTILRNDSNPAPHYLQVKLRANGANRFAIGARVTLRTKSLQLSQEVHSGQGYQSHFGDRLYFGLGPDSVIEWLDVHWPDGTVQRQTNIPANQVLEIQQREN